MKTIFDRIKNHLSPSMRAKPDYSEILRLMIKYFHYDVTNKIPLQQPAASHAATINIAKLRTESMKYQ